MAERCVCCGEIIPEGRQVCPNCENEPLREKLIKLQAECFDKCLKSRCTECEHFNAPPIIGNNRACQAHLFADTLIANGVTVTDNNVGGKWISVKDRLPEPFCDVLIYDATFRMVVMGYITLHKEWIGVGIKNDITHWMPLPQPPKGE